MDDCGCRRGRVNFARRDNLYNMPYPPGYGYREPINQLPLSPFNYVGNYPTEGAFYAGVNSFGPYI